MDLLGGEDRVGRLALELPDDEVTTLSPADFVAIIMLPAQACAPPIRT